MCLRLTCTDHYSLDQFACVESGLDDIGATEECMSLMLFCVVGDINILPPITWCWVWEVGFCHRNTFT